MATTYTVEELVRDRWTQATARSVRYKDEDAISIDRSKLYGRLYDSMEELAAILAGGEVTGRTYEVRKIGDVEVPVTEYDALSWELDRLMELVAERLRAWAVNLIEDRERAYREVQEQRVSVA